MQKVGSAEKNLDDSSDEFSDFHESEMNEGDTETFRIIGFENYTLP